MDFTTLGVQAVAAAAAVGVLWLAARKDSRDARTEFQRSIETLMAPRLEILDGKIDTKLEALEGRIGGRLEALEGRIDGKLEALEGKIDGLHTENADIRVRLNAIEEHLRQRRVK